MRELPAPGEVSAGSHASTDSMHIIIAGRHSIFRQAIAGGAVRHVRSAVILLCTLAVLASPAQQASAQEAREPLPAYARALLMDQLVVPLTYDPSVRSATAGSGISPFLEVKKDGQQVGLRIGLKRSDCFLDMRIRAPFNEESDRAQVADLKGFASDFSVDIGTTLVFWKPKASVSELRALEIDPSGAQSTPVPCAAKVSESQGIVWSDLQKTALVRITSPVRPVFATARLLAARKSFRFLDESSLLESTRRRTSYSIETAIGILFPDESLGVMRAPPSGTFLQLTLAYAVGYQAADAVTLCNQIPGSGLMRCRSIAFGRPTRESQQLLEIDVRRSLGRFLSIDPRVGWDWRSGGWSAELPIYLTRQPTTQDNAAWTVGAAGGYRSGDHAFYAVAFLSASLNLFPGP